MIDDIGLARFGPAAIAAFLTAVAPAAFAQTAVPPVFADVAVGDLVGADVKAGDGSSLGEVERVVALGGDVVAVVGVGGFLGFGEHDVAIPLQEFAPGEDALTLAGYSEEDLKAMVAWGGDGEALPLNVTVSGTPVETEAVTDPVAPADGDATVTE